MRSDPRRGSGLPLLVLSILSLILLVGIRLADPQPVETIRNAWFDQLQRLQPREAPPLPVRIVDIDERSLGQIGQWPWPRDIHARLVERLWDAGAAVIAFDVLFSEADRLSPARVLQDLQRRGIASPDISAGAAALFDNDIEFAEVMASRDVVLGTALVGATGAEGPAPKAGFVEIGPGPSGGLHAAPSSTPVIEVLADAARGIGMVSVTPERSDTITRSVPLAWQSPQGVMPALSVEALRVALGETTFLLTGADGAPGLPVSLAVADFTVPTTSDGQILLHFRPDDETLYISAGDVLANSLNADESAGLQGAIVFVGTSAAGLLDIHRSPLGQDIPGVSVHAQIIEQILTGSFLARTAVVAIAEILVLTALCLLLLASFVFAGPITSFLCGGISTVGVIAASWVLFQRQGVLFDATYPIIAGLLMFTIMVAWQFLVADREKRKIRRSFAHYVSDEVLRDMERRDHQLELGGTSRPATVMFCDVRGFTPLSERLEAAELVALLNALFTVLGNEILARQGTIDKFIGDAIMAFWNAPTDQPDHAQRGLNAALGMRAALRRFNGERDSDDIRLAIGLATGEVMVGNIGSRDRFNYSVIGQTVNLCSRIEAACRHVDYDILATGHKQDGANGVAALSAGWLDLKGLSEPVEAFVITGDEEVRRSDAFKTLKAAHDALLYALACGADDILEHVDVCKGLAERIDRGLGPFYDRLPMRRDDFARLAHARTEPVASFG